MHEISAFSSTYALCCGLSFLYVLSDVNELLCVLPPENNLAHLDFKTSDLNNTVQMF